MTATLSIDSAIEVFKKAKRPFVGRLISEEAKPGECKYCAQGLVLNSCGVSDEQMRRTAQTDADFQVAKMLGISRAESILLRTVNDGGPGLPQAVLILSDEGIGSVIGKEWRKIVSFWRYIDTLDDAGWLKGDAARAAARAAAGAAARAAARAAAGAAARAAAWAAAWAAARAAAWAAARAAERAAAGAAARAAEYATLEIMGCSLLKEPFFLPIFGFKTVNDIPLIDAR